MRPSNIFTSALFLSTASCSVWQAGQDIARAVEELAPLLKRQQTTTFNTDFTGVEGNTATTSSSTSQSASVSGSTTESGSAASSTGTDASSSGTDSATSGATTGSGSGSITATATGSGSATNTGSSGGTTSMPTFDPRLPPGGLSMIEPNPYTTTFYKIDDYITFQWNYTSLSITPSAIDVLASCSVNKETYTIALNQTVSGPTQTIVWDTKAYQSTASQQLLTEQYTLIVHDADKPASATAQAGYLGTFSQFTFAMYLPQAFTPMADYVCVTCSAGWTTIERQTVGAVLSMAAVTVLTFTWFTGVAGVW